MTIAEEEIDTGSFGCISVCLDPGAPDSVIRTRECKDIFVGETARSKSGYAYEEAGGRKIVNEGQKSLTLMSQDGDMNAMGFQVVDVNGPFGFVAEFVDAGYRIVFERNGAYIENSHGWRTRLRRSNGMWYLDCWRIPHRIASDPEELKQRFARQG